jgi:hypothetical protein
MRRSRSQLYACSAFHAKVEQLNHSCVTTHVKIDQEIIFRRQKLLRLIISITRNSLALGKRQSCFCARTAKVHVISSSLKYRPYDIRNIKRSMPAMYENN